MEQPFFRGFSRSEKTDSVGTIVTGGGEAVAFFSRLQPQ
jgi:hypothetical protein